MIGEQGPHGATPPRNDLQARAGYAFDDASQTCETYLIRTGPLRPRHDRERKTAQRIRLNFSLARSSDEHDSIQ